MAFIRSIAQLCIFWKPVLCAHQSPLVIPASPVPMCNIAIPLVPIVTRQFPPDLMCVRLSRPPKKVQEYMGPARGKGHRRHFSLPGNFDYGR